jgi:hypothetical protein
MSTLVEYRCQECTGCQEQWVDGTVPPDDRVPRLRRELGTSIRRDPSRRPFGRPGAGVRAGEADRRPLPGLPQRTEGVLHGTVGRPSPGSTGLR